MANPTPPRPTPREEALRHYDESLEFEGNARDAWSKGDTVAADAYALDALACLQRAVRVLIDEATG